MDDTLRSFSRSRPRCPGYQRLGAILGFIAGSLLGLVSFTAEFQSLGFGVTLAVALGALVSYAGFTIGGNMPVQAYDRRALAANLFTWALIIPTVGWAAMSLVNYFGLIFFGVISKFSLIFLPFYLFTGLAMGLVSGLAFALVMLWHEDAAVRSPRALALYGAIGLASGGFEAWFWNTPPWCSLYLGLLYPLFVVSALWGKWVEDNRASGFDGWGQEDEFD